MRNLLTTSKNASEYLTGTFNHEHFSFKPTTYNIVRQKIGQLKNSNSRDCYGINTKILKTLKNLLVSPITNLINQCIASAVFPACLKVAKVIPIFKNKGSVDDVNNYRPISLLPTFSKIFESILKDQINTYFETNNMFSQGQYGFRNKRSTSRAIDSLTECVSEVRRGGLIPMPPILT